MSRAAQHRGSRIADRGSAPAGRTTASSASGARPIGIKEHASRAFELGPCNAPNMCRRCYTFLHAELPRHATYHQAMSTTLTHQHKIMSPQEFLICNFLRGFVQFVQKSFGSARKRMHNPTLTSPLPQLTHNPLISAMPNAIRARSIHILMTRLHCLGKI
jgi:hypothetical protein